MNPKAYLAVGFALALTTAAASAASGYKFAERRLNKKFGELLEEETERLREHYALRRKDETPEEALKRLHPDTHMEQRPLKPPVPVSQYQKLAREYGAPGSSPIKGIRDPEEKTNIFDEVQEETGIDPGEEVEGPVPVFVQGYSTEDIIQYVQLHENDEDPFIIMTELYLHGEPGYDQGDLEWYVNDETLVDEKEVPIDNINEIVGIDNLSKFGHMSGDPNVVYVRNHRLKMDFEITRIENSFAVVVLGLDPEQTRRRR